MSNQEPEIPDAREGARARRRVRRAAGEALRIASMSRAPRGGAQSRPRTKPDASVCARSTQGDHRLEGRPLGRSAEGARDADIRSRHQASPRFAWRRLSWSAGWKAVSRHPGGALAQHMQTRAQLDEMRRRGLRQGRTDRRPGGTASTVAPARRRALRRARTARDLTRRVQSEEGDPAPVLSQGSGDGE